MIYIVAFGKFCIIIAIILFLLSIIPWLVSCTKKTEHGINACWDEMTSMQGWGIGLFLLGIGLIILPILLPGLIKIIVVCIKVIFTIILLPFQLLL